MKYKAHPTELKKAQVAHMQQLIENHPVVALVDLEGLPSLQLQRMRTTLRKEEVELFMSKGKLITLALEKASKKNKDVLQLKEHIRGMPALIATKKDAFSLAATLKKSRSPAPARAGQTAPNDVMISAGPTPFAPGPIIGELGAAGIKAGIDAGKVIIKEDSKVLKEGDVVTPQLAGILSRLGIEPMEIGLNLIVAFEDGMIYKKSVLEVDEQEYLDKLALAATESLNLAFNVAYPTQETITLLIAQAYRDSRALADSQDIVTSDNVADVLAKAQRQANALGSKVPQEGENA